jgi:hypothetical protein
MQGEKHNEESWKSKLDDLSGLPGEALIDKEAAWDNLHARLREKPARKKTGWYWAAAACLLLALAMTWMTGHRKQSSPAIATGHYQPAHPRIIAPVVALKENPVKDTHPIPVETTQLVKNNITTSPVNNMATARRPKHEPSAPAQTVSLVETQTPATTLVIPALLPDSPVIALAAAAPKKKLRVVSLSELNATAEESRKSSGNSNRHYFQLKLMTADAGANTVTQADRNSPGIFKIKLSPQN